VLDIPKPDSTVEGVMPAVLLKINPECAGKIISLEFDVKPSGSTPVQNGLGVTLMKIAILGVTDDHFCQKDTSPV
jgi:hypothetical protein